MLDNTRKSLFRFAVGAGLVALAAGCTNKSNTSTSDSTTMVRTDTVNAATTDTSHANAPAALTDANILAMMGEADSSEITEAKAVMAKSKNSEVKGFAQMMVTEHGRMKSQGAALAKQINVAPQPPANDPMPGDLTSALSMINSSTDTHALDSEYIAQAIDDHQNDLTSLQNWKNQAQNADLKAAIDKAMPIVQKHLDAAHAVQTKLAQMPAGSAKGGMKMKMKMKSAKK